VKALRFDRFGSLGALAVADTPRPVPGPDEVCVRVEAAALNPSDVKNVLGRFAYTTLPRTPGRDFAGVVVDGPAELIGREVWGSGRELGFTRDGSHAEYLTLPAAAAAAKPANLSFAEAACAGTPYLTALEALDRTGVREGTRLVVIGQGAVGRAALALGAGYGAAVVAAVRRDDHAATLRGDGVATALLGPGFADSIHDHFGDCADVVFDTTGAWLPDAVRALAPAGRVAVIAAPSDGHVHVPVLDLYRRGGSIIGVNSLLHDTVATARSLGILRAAFETGVIGKPDAIVHRDLADAVAAYHDLDAGARDKFALIP
jgi:NADPH:quinone reductase-like Zn-dependent oxidoreductase